MLKCCQHLENAVVFFHEDADDRSSASAASASRSGLRLFKPRLEVSVAQFPVEPALNFEDRIGLNLCRASVIVLSDCIGLPPVDLQFAECLTHRSIKAAADSKHRPASQAVRFHAGINPVAQTRNLTFDNDLSKGSFDTLIFAEIGEVTRYEDVADLGECVFSAALSAFWCDVAGS